MLIATPVAVPAVLSKASTYALALRFSIGTTASCPLWRKMTKPLTFPEVVSCAEPTRSVGAPVLWINNVAPAASVCVTEEAVLMAAPACG